MAQKRKGKGRLVIISSPSGGGKSSVIRHFLSTHPNMIHSISWTTRPMRPDKADAKDYHFTDVGAFKEGIKNNQFAEWAEVHNHLYGTPKGPLDKWISEGKDVLLDVDVVGGMNLKKLYKEQAISIFLVPPSIEELEKRLSQRGTDPEKVRQVRLRNALNEMMYKDEYDYQVVNDVLERACREIEKILI